MYHFYLVMAYCWAATLFSLGMLNRIQLLMGSCAHSFASGSSALTPRNYFPKSMQFPAGALLCSGIPSAGTEILPLGHDHTGSTTHLLFIPNTPLSRSLLHCLTPVAGQVYCAQHYSPFLLSGPTPAKSLHITQYKQCSQAWSWLPTGSKEANQDCLVH